MQTHSNPPRTTPDRALLRHLVQMLPSEYLTPYGVDANAIAREAGVTSNSVRRWFTGAFSKKALRTFVHISARAGNPAERGRINEQDLLPFLLG